MLGTLRLSQPTFFWGGCPRRLGLPAWGVPSNTKIDHGLKNSKGCDRVPILN